MKLLSLTLVTALVFAIGCTNGSEDTAETTAEAVTEDVVEAVDQGSEAVEAEMVTLTGKTGCGHCTFHKGESCAAALQTADGKIYLLDNIGPETDLFKKRMDGVPVTVTGTVAEREGDFHVTVASHELM